MLLEYCETMLNVGLYHIIMLERFHINVRTSVDQTPRGLWILSVLFIQNFRFSGSCYSPFWKRFENGDCVNFSNQSGRYEVKMRQRIDRRRRYIKHKKAVDQHIAARLMRIYISSILSFIVCQRRDI